MGDQKGFVGDARRMGHTGIRTFAWAAFGLAAAAALAALVSGPGNRFGWWDYRVAFDVLRWGAWGGATGAALSLVALALAARHAMRRSAVVAVIGLTAGALAFALPWQARSRARDVPPIHDITTDTADPPRFVAVLALRKGAPNGVQYEGEKVASQQRKAYPDIAPLVLPVPPAAAFERCLAAARALGWDIVAAAPGDLRIEATDTTPFFGFKDDIVLRITPSGAGSRVDVRSVSRVGRSDLGVNARRVRAFLAQLGKYPASRGPGG